MGKLGIGIVLLLTFVSEGILGVAVGPIDGPAVFPRFTERFNVSALRDDSPGARFRLPNQIVPRHYKLELRPILNEGEVGRFTAPGVVQITVECMQTTNNLVLHAIDFPSIDTIRVWPTNSPNNNLTIQGRPLDPVNQTLTIQVLETLTVGVRYEIYIEYVAKIYAPSERMEGLYWSSYVNEANETRYLATTQFSRRLAFRRMLPSFDEPNQKATFEISVGRQAPYHTLCNMDIRMSEPIAGLPGWTWDRYNVTPVMPPTIIAIIVSDFDSETAPPALFNKPTKIWGPPPEIEDDGGVFAAQAAARTLQYFQDYFGIEYELPKIDSVAIPDFAAGAMENWGLNTYQIYYLIWKQGVNTVAEKFRVGNIIGHELAHQYWGNLVTHAWWNDWWLTEGFASYFEYRSLEVIHPDFEAINRVITSDTQPAMTFDAGPLSVPIHGSVNESFVENPSQINYNKGAALVNMMRSFMSEGMFQKALSYYLRNRAYDAVYQDALFEDLNVYLTNNNAMPSNNKTIKEIMDTWTRRTSFPLVKLSLAGPSRVYISQERFSNLITKDPQQEPSGLWHIPVSLITANNPIFDDENALPDLWIDKDVLLTSYEINNNQWILLNPNGRGYYRVMYDAYFAALLRAQLESNVISIPVGSRSMIVDDYFNFAYQGYNTITEAMRMTKFIENDTEFNTWVPFMKHLLKAYQMFSSDTTQFNLFKNYILNSMRASFTKIGYKQLPNEPPMSSTLRVQLFEWACSMFDSGCVAEANSLLAEWKLNTTFNPIPVDIRAHIYCASTSDLSTGNWDFLMSQYDTSRDPLVRNALACSSDSATLQRILLKVMTDATVPQGDMVAFVQRVAMNSVGRPLVISMLENDFTDVVDPTKLRPAGVASVYSSLATYVREQVEISRLQTIVENNELVLLPVMDSINASFQQMSANMVWMGNFGNAIFGWLNLQSP